MLARCGGYYFQGRPGSFLHCQVAAKTARNIVMSTVAEQLRTAREARNLSINEVAEITKIRTDHIRALEEGNFDVFVAPVYIRGFTRTYATLLKLEVPAVIKALEVELSRTEKFAEPPSLSDTDKSVVNFLTLQLSKLNLHRRELLVGVGIVVAVMVVIFVLRQQRKPATQPVVPPARVQTAPQNSGQTLPLPDRAPARR